MPKGIINQSYELRKHIIHRAEEHNIPLSWLCRSVGIAEDRFISGYCNKKNLSTTFPDVTDSELVDIATKLGIDVRVQLVLRKMDESEMKDLKRMLHAAYSYKKKGSSAAAKSSDT